MIRPVFGSTCKSKVRPVPLGQHDDGVALVPDVPDVPALLIEHGGDLIGIEGKRLQHEARAGIDPEIHLLAEQVGRSGVRHAFAVQVGDVGEAALL